jgi:IclR family acetate operon transcriptional repressor
MADSSEVQSVQRAARILVALVDTNDDPTSTKDGQSVKSLAAETQLPVSTTHRLLRTLVDCHLVEQDSRTEKYRLGPLTAVLGQTYRHHSDLERVEELLTRLANATGESVSLAALQDRTAIVISHVQSSHVLRVGYSLGTSLAMHASAMGKVLLAYSSSNLEDTITQLGKLESFTNHTITEPTDLLQELVNTKNTGFATNFAERFDGANGVAVPIIAMNDNCRFALGIQGPESRITRKRVKELAEACKRCAEEISDLGLLYRTV